jgi:SAM-dependent methyltransferase
MADGIVDLANWRSVNRANWDERVAVHLKTSSYDLQPLRSGCGELHAIEEGELGFVDGLRVLHLQCHFGLDTLTLAQRGAQVVGIDFSGPAIEAACNLADELGLSARAQFIECDLYHTPDVLLEPESFDLVYVTWGAINWLPDIEGWARVVAGFLKPGGKLYLAEGHPAALVFDDAIRMPDNMPGFYAPYFHTDAIVIDDPRDYADPNAVLQNSLTYEWIHPLGKIVSSLLESGMKLDWLHEHDSVSWQMFDKLVEDDQGMYRWPDKAWLPLAFSLQATRVKPGSVP